MLSLTLQNLIILGIGIVIGVFVYEVLIKRSTLMKQERIEETAKMTTKIMLDNNWECIDNMIMILKNRVVHIEYELRK